MGYRSEESRDSLNPPSIEPVWWVFFYEGSKCFVLARLWIEARDIATTELGGDPTAYQGPYATLEETDSLCAASQE